MVLFILFFYSSYTSKQYCLGSQITEVAMGWACGNMNEDRMNVYRIFLCLEVVTWKSEKAIRS
jgi:hypothetical protein